MVVKISWLKELAREKNYPLDFFFTFITWKKGSINFVSLGVRIINLLKCRPNHEMNFRWIIIPFGFFLQLAKNYHNLKIKGNKIHVFHLEAECATIVVIYENECDPFILKGQMLVNTYELFCNFAQQKAKAVFLIINLSLVGQSFSIQYRNDRNSNFITVKDKFMHARRLRQKNLSVLQIFLYQINTVILGNGSVSMNSFVIGFTLWKV